MRLVSLSDRRGEDDEERRAVAGAIRMRLVAHASPDLVSASALYIRNEVGNVESRRSFGLGV